MERLECTVRRGGGFYKSILNASPDTAAGVWAIYYDDIAMTRSDGTVLPIFTGETSVSFWQVWGTSGVSGRSYEALHQSGLALSPGLTIRYYHQDQLGTERLQTVWGGWPIWQSTFAPFGEEANPQMTMNHYKFTDLEHDAGCPTHSHIDMLFWMSRTRVPHSRVLFVRVGCDEGGRSIIWRHACASKAHLRSW